MAYDIAVVGGGIMGAADLYVFSRFTDASAVLIEKNAVPGLVASHGDRNSQTHHRGDIETQYDLETSLRVKEQAEPLARFVSRYDTLSQRMTKMLLAEEHELPALQQRYASLKPYFPELALLDEQGVADYEPLVADGREGSFGAIVDPAGLGIDFGRAAGALVEAARRPGIDVLCETRVDDISRQSHFALATTQGPIAAGSLILSAGAHTLPLAQHLGLGEAYCVFPVAGGFFRSPRVLGGKVYTFQRPGIPFVAVHGDPDVNDASVTRFGPTAYPVPFLEWKDWSTMRALLKAAPPRRAFRAMRVLDRQRSTFFLENARYLLPGGRRAFLPNVQRIVPSLGVGELKRDATLGGVRPQVVDARRGRIVHGEARLIGCGVIANLTPSPGASTCLSTARDDARRVVRWLGGRFDEEGFDREFS